MNERIEVFFRLFNERDLDGMGALLAEDAVFRFPKTADLEGRERILRFLKLLLRRFPELEFTLRETVTEGETAAAWWTNRGVDRQGEPYANEGATWIRWREGAIVSISDFFKDTEKF